MDPKTIKFVINPEREVLEDAKEYLVAPIDSIHFSYDALRLKPTKSFQRRLFLLALSDDRPLGLLEAAIGFRDLFGIKYSQIQIGSLMGPGLALGQSSAENLTHLTEMLNVLDRLTFQIGKGTATLISLHLSPSLAERIGWTLKGLGFAPSICQTPILELAKNKHSMLRQIPKKRRNSIRQAMKRRVNIVSLEGNTAQGVFLSLKKVEAFQKKSNPLLDSVHYKNLALAQDMGMMKLWFAKVGSKYCGAIGVWTLGKTLGYSIGAMDRRFQTHRPMDALLWRAIEWGIEEGFQTFNMLGVGKNPKGELDGIGKYKMSFGAKMRTIISFSGLSLASPFLPNKLRKMPNFLFILRSRNAISHLFEYQMIDNSCEIHK
ncbi:MAG: GNAT family N-acetyltransferase [Candidatus Heimdallarchaeota archaeon]